MKKVLLPILCLLCVYSSFAQTQDAQLEQMMTRRALSKEDVKLNIMTLAPKLYSQGKTDTIKQLLDYYERNFAQNSLFSPLSYLIKIKERNFAEELRTRYSVYPSWNDTAYYNTYIITFLKDFKTLCANMAKPNYYGENVREAYIPYLSFIGHLATDLQSIPDLASAEHFLLRFYANPTDSILASLKDPEYNGTRVQRLWLAQFLAPRKSDDVSGISLGIASGAWVPTGNLSLLGTHPYAGFIVGGRGRKFGIDANVSFRFLRAHNNYNVTVDNVGYNTHYYLGAFVGLDGNYELKRKGKNALEVLGGVAWDGFDALPGSNDDKEAPTKTIGSLNLNLGIGYRLFLTQGVHLPARWQRTARPEYRTSFLAIQAKFNYLNYHNEGGTALNGNAFTIGIIYGAYARPAKNYTWIEQD